MAKRIGFALDLHCRLFNPSTRKDNYFEASMQKLEFLLQNCDVLIQAGDFFDKARTEDVVKNRILNLLNRYKVPIYVVPGNHDVENDLLETLPNTSLANLAYHNAVTILTPDKIWNIEGLKIGVLDFYVEKAKKQSFDEVDVVVGHHFYNWFRDPSKSIEPQDVDKYNTNYLILGHDHEPHEDLQLGNTIIIRTGSILRTELASYTNWHSPCFHIIEVNGSKYSPIKKIEIPYTPFELAFLHEEKKTFKKCAKLVSEIKAFLENIELQSENKKSIGEILIKELKAPKEVVEYLSLIYRCNHQPF